MFVFSPAYADLNTGLVANYSFDDCTAKDSSSNANNGTVTGNLQCTDGKINKGLLFDGSSYINVPSSTSLNPVNQLTMSFWIRIDDFTNDYSAIINKGGAASSGYRNREYSVWLNKLPYLHQTSAGDNSDDKSFITKENSFDKGKWLHYVGVIDRVNHVSKIYINGQLNAQQADSYSSFNNNNESLRIGLSKENSVVESPFKGALDEMRFYNRAISETEVKSLYNMGQLSGTVNGVQKYSAVCKNLKTGVSKKIPLADGAKEWNCTAAGVKSKKGESVSVTITGVSQ